MKVYKNGKLIGPEIEGFFKAVAEPAKGGGVEYLTESLDAKESWRIALSAEDVKRIANAHNRPKEKTYGELSAELGQILKRVGKKT